MTEEPSKQDNPSSPHPLTSSPLHLLILLFILTLAAILRLYQLDLIDIRFDEASAMQSALAIARGQWLAVAPYSGSVANHPPVYLYVMALPYLITRDPLIVAGYRAMLDVLAIGLCYAMCQRYFGLRVATWAALFYALAPWAIQQARKTWLAPLPLWGVLLLWGLLEVVQRRNPRGWILTGAAFALSLGTHLSAIYLLPIIVLVALWRWRTLRPLPVLMGLLPIALLALIYIGHDAQTNYANLHALFNGATANANPTRTVSLDSFRFALWLSGGAHLSDLTGPAFAAWQSQFPDWLTWLDTVQMGLLLLFFILALLNRKSPQAPALLLLAAYFLVPIVVQLRPAQPLQLHYLLPLYPVQFVMLGWVVGGLTTAHRPQTPDTNRQSSIVNGQWIAVVGGLLSVVVLSWQLFTTLRFNNFIASHNTANGGYGEPIRTALAAKRMVREGISAGLFSDVIIIAPGGDSQVNEAATILDVLLADVPHRFTNADTGLILRGEPTQYLFTPGTEAAQARLLRSGWLDSPQQQASQFRGDDDRRYVRITSAKATLGNVPPLQRRWANGIELLNVIAQRKDDVLSANTFALVTPAALPGRNTHWYVHVLNANDQKLGQLDTGGVPFANWRVGDVLWHWFDVPLAPDTKPINLRIGAYQYPSLDPIQMLDVANNPSGDSFTVSLDH